MSNKNLPEMKIKSWKECPIAKYYEIQDLVNDKDLETYDKEVALISILCDVDESIIWDLNFEDFKKLQEKTEWISDISLRDIEKLKFKNITIEDKKFTVNGDLTKFTVAQYIDFQTFWTKRNLEDMKKIIGNVLVCFILPKGKKYGEDYDLQELAKFLYENLDIETAYEIISFFFVSWLRSMKNSLHLSARMMKKMSKKMSKEEWSQLIAKMAETEQALIDGFTLLTQ